MASNRLPKKGVVYLLKSECGKYYKYGASINLKNRIAQINKSNEFNVKFELLKYYPTLDIYKLEKHIKWKFWNSVCLTEFFIAEESSLSEINIIKTMEDVWKAVG